ncbi:hypothetical protein BH23PAT1_BH23PAT1_4640 [soil metagenome]
MNKSKVPLLVVAVIFLIAVSYVLYARLVFDTRKNVTTPNNPNQNQVVKTNDIPEECSKITEPTSQYQCYLRDNDRELLKRAVEEKNSELCSRIDHVFIPHDVQEDIKKGIIGVLITGDEAYRECLNSVQRGYIQVGR